MKNPNDWAYQRRVEAGLMASESSSYRKPYGEPIPLDQVLLTVVWGVGISGLLANLALAVVSRGRHQRVTTLLRRKPKTTHVMDTTVCHVALVLLFDLTCSPCDSLLHCVMFPSLLSALTMKTSGKFCGGGSQDIQFCRVFFSRLIKATASLCWYLLMPWINSNNY